MPIKDIEKRRIYTRRYMQKWERLHPERRRAYNEAAKARNVQFVWEFKAQRGCALCPERDPVCLDLHHRLSADKEINPADMSQRGWSLSRIQVELDKCDVLCANCHRKLHWKQRAESTLPS